MAKEGSVTSKDPKTGQQGQGQADLSKSQQQGGGPEKERHIGKDGNADR